MESHNHDICKFAVDLTGIRKVESGIGFYIAHLVKGLHELQNPFQAYLIVGQGQPEILEQIETDHRIVLIVTQCPATSRMKRMLWINFHLSKLLRENNIDLCFEPYYSMPIYNLKSVRYVTTIHDLQALHYPQFQSFMQNMWLRWMWPRVLKKACHIITISEFCKKDIIAHYHVHPSKISVIYNAACVEKADAEVFDRLSRKYGITDKKYYYTVSKIRPNKNFITLINVFEELHKRGETYHLKLLISGANGGDADRVTKMVKEKGISDCVVLTGFISDEERNALYEHAKAFLFPSVFEGFGLPVIEAAFLGTTIITTKCASLFEVTQGKANYVNDPYSIDEWINKIHTAENHSNMIDFSAYTREQFASNILTLLEKVGNIDA